MLNDVRYALRSLRNAPTFSAVAILTLAVGIGATTALFSVINATLLRPLDYDDPDRIVAVWEQWRDRPDRVNTISPANFLDWRDQADAFETMAAGVDFRANLTGAGEPEEVPVQAVSVEMFPLLGVDAALGRTFVPEEGREGGNDVAVLSHGLWQRRFGGRADVIGRTLMLGGEPKTIVGVIPAGFQLYVGEGALTATPPELWVPYVFRDVHRIRRGRFMFALARLKPGVSVERAQAEMDAVAAQFEREYPDFNTGWGVRVIPLKQHLVGHLRRALLILMGAVGLVLLIACANIANLLLARMTARQREIAVRSALGASRGRLVRQLLVESLVLAMVGGGLGILVSIWAVDLMLALSPDEIRRAAGAATADARVLGFGLVVSALTALVFGVAPALEPSARRLSEWLKDTGRTSTADPHSRRLRQALVVGQVALALMLLVGAGLLVRSLARLQAVDPGFDPERVITMRVQLPNTRYPEPAQRVQFFRQLVDRAASLPGVRAAGSISFLPFAGGLGARTSFQVVGEPEPLPGQGPGTDVRVVDPGYFETMRIPLLRGRLFTDREGLETANVVIVNETLARQMFPGEDPLGRRLIVHMSDEPEADEIIGVVGDTKHSRLDEQPYPAVYWPHPRFPYPFMSLVIRTDGETAGLVSAVRRVAQALDPEQPIADVATFETLLGRSVAQPRFQAALLAAFAGVALLLALVGIYGVVAYSVAQRTRELGIRVALGAGRRRILRLVLGQAFGLAVAGGVAGLALAFAVTRLLAGLLYDVSPTDAWTFAVVTALLVGAAVAAALPSASRAARVDPVVALRAE